MTFLNQIHLDLVRGSAFGPAERRGDRLAIHLDGISLIDLLTAVEWAQAEREGAPALAGNYVWPKLTRELRGLLEGRDDARQPCGSGLDHRAWGAVVLNCACGLDDCWPLTFRVQVGLRFVTWSGFQQLRRREGSLAWDYSELGTFRFERQAYDAQLARLSCASRLTSAGVGEPAAGAISDSALVEG